MFTLFHLMARIFALFVALDLMSSARVSASTLPTLHARQDSSTPTFPSDIPSCNICAQNFQNIDSCAQAAPVLANFTQVRIDSYSLCNTCISSPFFSLSFKLLSNLTLTFIYYHIDHLQPRRFHLRDRMRMHRHLPIRLPAMRRLLHANEPNSVLNSVHGYGYVAPSCHYRYTQYMRA